MPGGSKYSGPSASLTHYQEALAASGRDIPLKGAKNPYTSRNGHMFSFLTPEGTLAIRLSDELRVAFAADFETSDVVQYGSVMRGHASVPGDVLEDPAVAGEWLAKSFDWIGTLPPKPTKK